MASEDPPTTPSDGRHHRPADEPPGAAPPTPPDGEARRDPSVASLAADHIRRQYHARPYVVGGLAIVGLIVVASLVALLISTAGAAGSRVDAAAPLPAPPPAVADPRPDRAPAVAPSVGRAPADASPPLQGPPVDPDTVSEDEVKHGVGVPDGPAQDMEPYGVDARALIDELEGHGVPIDDSFARRLVDMADKHIARGDPDLDAWDPAITRDIKAMFPGLTRKQYKDLVRCTAEYVERVIAREAGTVPPDSVDDHTIN